MNQYAYNMNISTDILLNPNNSLYSIEESMYNLYDSLLTKYEPLVLNFPYEQAKIPCFAEVNRDVFFNLIINKDALVEIPMLQMVYITRSKLIQLITKSKRFQQACFEIKGDPDHAFVFSFILLANLLEWHELFFKKNDLLDELELILVNKNVDLRPLFLESFTEIEPYPKRIVYIQQKISNHYTEIFNDNKQAFDLYIHNSFQQTNAYFATIHHFDQNLKGGNTVAANELIFTKHK